MSTTQVPGASNSDTFPLDPLPSQHKKDTRETSPQGRYVKLDERLGSGAYKDVWRAYDTNEGMEVAWNVVKLGRIPPGERKRIKTEVKLLRDIEHKNVIKYYNSWVDREKEQIVFITEIMSSGSLKDYLRKNPMIRWNAVKRWCRQILRALEFLHENQIIHRDIKCDNIFINGATGDLRIGDLGLSTRISEERAGLSAAAGLDTTSAGTGGLRAEIREITAGAMTCLGTPEFMAPELYDENYNEKVDIYAFGMTLLEMVTGLTPYHHCTSAPQIYKKVLRGEPPQELEQVQASSPAAHAFIDRCLQKKDVRPSAKELLASPFLLPNDDEDYKEVRIWHTHAILEGEEEDDGETVSSGNTMATAATAGSNTTIVSPEVRRPASSQSLFSLDAEESIASDEKATKGEATTTTTTSQASGTAADLGNHAGNLGEQISAVQDQDNVAKGTVQSPRQRNLLAAEFTSPSPGPLLVSGQAVGGRSLSSTRFRRKTGSGVLEECGSGVHALGSGVVPSSGDIDVEQVATAVVEDKVVVEVATSQDQAELTTRPPVNMGTNATIVDVTDGSSPGILCFHLRVPMKESGIIATEPDVLVEFEYSLDKDDVCSVVQEMKNCEELCSLAIDADHILSLLQPMVTIATRISPIIRANKAAEVFTGLAETLVQQVLEANPEDSPAGWVLRHLRAGWLLKQTEKAERTRGEIDRLERERREKELEERREQEERERALEEDEEYRAIAFKRAEAVARTEKEFEHRMTQISQQRERLEEAQRRESETLSLRRGDLDIQMASMQDKFQLRMHEFASRKAYLVRLAAEQEELGTRLGVEGRDGEGER